MPIRDRKTAAIAAARRAPKHVLRAFASHFINTRGIGPQKLPPHRGTHPFVRCGWTHPNGRLTADGGIVGRAYMDVDSPLYTRGGR